MNRDKFRVVFLQICWKIIGQHVGKTLFVTFNSVRSLSSYTCVIFSLEELGKKLIKD